MSFALFGFELAKKLGGLLNPVFISAFRLSFAFGVVMSSADCKCQKISVQ